ncbi:MAG: SelB C-terminal domain-containing protein, partial [Oscillospiraceae bacterium]|nr:SelB C-terminal domain-containing protein [Oscillospiraceae bacterium]
TKIDMIDEEWLELVRDDVNEYISEGPFAGAPVVELSAVTEKGIPELIETIEELCKEITERPSAGLMRLAIDRVFTKAGFGTVVTGTLWGGTIRQGDTIELLPSRKQARVRSLQVHGEKREEAYAGERVAINLTGIEKEHVERGSWLSEPSAISESRRIDIRLTLLSEAPEISQRIRIHVHHGTAEVLARVKLLDRNILLPGESCYAQLDLEEPLSSLPGDRLILRFYSPTFTIGGGTVLDPKAARHKNRHIDEGISRLEALHSKDPKQVLLATMTKAGLAWHTIDIASCLQTNSAPAEKIASELTESGHLLQLADGYFYPANSMDSLKEKLEAWLKEYSDKWPMRLGSPKKEAAQYLLPKMEHKQQRLIFQHLETQDNFEQDEKSIKLKGWSPNLTDTQAKTIEAIQSLYGKTPLAPPTWAEISAELGIPAKEQSEYLLWLQSNGKLTRVSDDTHYTPEALEEAERILRSKAPEGYTLAQARDLLGISRKYAQKISEHFDQTKLTHRDGERRYWRP